MIEQVVSKYDFNNVKWHSPDVPVVLDPVFVIRFHAVPAEIQDGCIFHAPGLTLEMKNLSENDPADRHFNRNTQNYFSLKSPDGSCRVMEAALFQQGDNTPWRIGFPLRFIRDPEAEHEFALLFDGVYFNIICDGEVIDREQPWENCIRQEEPPQFRIDSPAVRNLVFSNDLSAVRRYEDRIRRDVPVMYYTPYGFNTWIGDVVTFAYEGLFHIFYLHDRRHHGSRRGKGAHEFWHMTSRDLKNWVDHGPVMELNKPWQSFGTGNAFVYNGKLHLSFGWHTERCRTAEQMADSLFEENLRTLGHTGEFTYDGIAPLTPSGASYLSSEDGIHFTPSETLIHYLRNPSIFTQPDGTLHLYQEGKWESDHPGCFRLLDRDFPPFYEKSFARNSVECPNFFSLGDWDYFMVGFSGFFGKKKEAEQWIDFVEKGWDPYDGACVPMATEFNGRMIEGSWPNGNGWGSSLLLRELFPLENGRVGKRWIPETLPEFGAPRATDTRVTLPERAVYTLLEVEVDPADGPFTTLFYGTDDEAPVEFFLDPVSGRAQWSGTPGKRLLTYREMVLANPDLHNFRDFKDTHYDTRDYAKENLTLPDHPFTIRILICRDPKFNSTLIDTEIAGKFTMLTHRKDLHATGVEFPESCKTITIRNS